MAPVEEGTSTKMELALQIISATAILVFISILALS